MDTIKIFRPDPRSRPKPFTFRPPKNNPLVLALSRLILPWNIRKKLKVTEIDISAEDLERLRALKGKRVLLTPTHSGGFEPYIVMYISKLLGDHYYYLAAMEAFEKSPLTAWIMQRVGAYSIIRGAVDRSSFQMTRKLLAEGKRWLVIFPEGQTVFQNDTVIPFQEGVFQLAFKAFEEVCKREEDPSLFCVPIAIKYVYLESLDDEIDASLDRLESHLFNAEKLEPLPRYERLRRIGEAVLVANEKKYKVNPEKGTLLNDRIQLMKEKIVCRIERQLEIKPKTGEALLDRIRTLFNTVDRIVSDESEVSPYEQHLMHELRNEVRILYEDLWRVLQLVAIYDGYVSELMTIERFMDVLCLLEMEVFRERRIWGPRKALVKVGEPLDFKDRFASYQENKREVIHEVTLALESAVREMLQELCADCKMVETGS